MPAVVVRKKRVPPAIPDTGARRRSGHTTIRVSRHTVDALVRVQELMPKWEGCRELVDADTAVYRMAKAVLGETKD